MLNTRQRPPLSPSPQAALQAPSQVLQSLMLIRILLLRHRRVSPAAHAWHAREGDVGGVRINTWPLLQGWRVTQVRISALSTRSASLHGMGQRPYEAPAAHTTCVLQL